MFNSTKIGDSPSLSKNALHKTLNETANGIPRSFLQPKITSTPLVRRESIFATPPKPHILSSRRYSLSEIATPPRTNRKDLSKTHAPGPLLASTRYNVNVSTYEDTKSPGLVGRILQYNEEAEREKESQRPPTHQAKYGSPGLFPVVHLFKKKLPTLEQKPRRVTVRIASPEYSRHHSQEYNRKLLEAIIKPNSPNSRNSSHVFASPSSESSNSSTRSVLEALKEISRKRIHANEEYELTEETSKRIRTENGNDLDSNKRLRDDSPLLDNTSPSKPVSKKICMYDEYAASCSSMNFSFNKTDQPGPKRKSISISTLTENPKESKQVKLINVETQTAPDEADKNDLAKEVVEEQTETIKDQTEIEKPMQKKESPVKIFDDAPLERIRKNRLAALMGSLAGKDPVLAPKPDYAHSLNSNALDTPDSSITEIFKGTDKPLVSILSSPKKDSPHKSNKHVHFNIPESMSQPNFSSASVTNFSITQSSTSITSPISSTCEARTSFGSNQNEDKLETPAPPSSPVGVTPSSSETVVTVPVLTFGSGSNSSSATSIVSKESSSSLLDTNLSKSDTAVPNFQFKPASSTSTLGSTASNIFPSSTTASQAGFGASINPPSSTTSPPKMGGFKFDLSKPTSVSTASAAGVFTTSASATSSVPKFTFGTTSQNDTNKNKPIFGNVGGTPTSTTSQSNLGSTSGGFFVGAKGTETVGSVSTTTTSNFSVSNAFGTTSTLPSFSIPATSTPAMPAFQFAGASAEKKATAAGFNLANSGFTSVPSSMPASGIGTSTISGMPSFGTSKVPTFSFGAPTTSSSVSSFGTVTTAVTTASAPIAFGTPATSATSGFGATPATSTFGTSLQTTGFGVVNAPSSLGGFGAPSTNTSSFGATTTSSLGGFGTVSTTSGGFGTALGTPSGGFGTSATTTSGFRPTATSTIGGFGVTSTSVNAGFGVPSTSANAGFGISSTTTAGGFGASSAAPMFGGNKSVPPFGVTTASTTPSFGTSTPSLPPFGKVSTPAFGQVTTQPSFGAPTTTVSFGTANSFGNTATTSASVFGGPTSTPAFGKPSGTNNIFGGATNTQPPGFGTATSKPHFGSATPSPFGNPAPATTTPAFGSTTTPTFNFAAKTTASNSFGAAFGGTTTASSGFGTATTPAFGNTNSFGNSSSNFGGGSSGTFGSSAPPAFGAVVTTTQSTGFGTSNATPAFGNANTNFGTDNKGPMFGASTTPAFGTAPTPSFGSTAPASNFGVANNTTGFGTNAAASAFAKPQTGFGSTPNAFGTGTGFPTNQAPATGFGTTNPSNTQTSVFNFGASTAQKPAGVFSFGAAAAGEPIKPTFNFTGGTSAPAFGNTVAPSFGTSGTPSFGAPGVPQFNPPQQSTAGMFSIGSGSSSGKSRTQLRAKRRT